MSLHTIRPSLGKPFACSVYVSLCAGVSVSSSFSLSFQSIRAFPQLSGGASPSSSSILCRSWSLSSSNRCCRFAFRFSFFFLFLDSLPVCTHTRTQRKQEKIQNKNTQSFRFDSRHSSKLEFSIRSDQVRLQKSCKLQQQQAQRLKLGCDDDQSATQGKVQGPRSRVHHVQLHTSDKTVL